MYLYFWTAYELLMTMKKWSEFGNTYLFEDEKWMLKLLGMIQILL